MSSVDPPKGAGIVVGALAAAVAASVVGSVVANKLAGDGADGRSVAVEWEESPTSPRDEARCRMVTVKADRSCLRSIGLRPRAFRDGGDVAFEYARVRHFFGPHPCMTVVPGTETECSDQLGDYALEAWMVDAEGSPDWTCACNAGGCEVRSGLDAAWQAADGKGGTFYPGLWRQGPDGGCVHRPCNEIAGFPAVPDECKGEP